MRTALLYAAALLTSLVWAGPSRAQNPLEHRLEGVIVVERYGNSKDYYLLTQDNRKVVIVLEPAYEHELERLTGKVRLYGPLAEIDGAAFIQAKAFKRLDEPKPAPPVKAELDPKRGFYGLTWGTPLAGAKGVGPNLGFLCAGDSHAAKDVDKGFGPVQASEVRYIAGPGKELVGVGMIFAKNEYFAVYRTLIERFGHPRQARNGKADWTVDGLSVSLSESGDKTYACFAQTSILAGIN